MTLMNIFFECFLVFFDVAKHKIFIVLAINCPLLFVNILNKLINVLWRSKYYILIIIKTKSIVVVLIRIADKSFLQLSCFLLKHLNQIRDRVKKLFYNCIEFVDNKWIGINSKKNPIQSINASISLFKSGMGLILIEIDGTYLE